MANLIEKLKSVLSPKAGAAGAAATPAAAGEMRALPLIGGLPVPRQLLILSALLVAFVVAAGVAAFLEAQTARYSSAYLDIAGRMQMHSQRVAKAAQLAALGNELAFDQLQDSRDRYNRHVRRLQEGGDWGGVEFPAMAGDAVAAMESVVGQWRAEEKDVNQVLAARDGLIEFTRSVGGINATDSRMLRLVTAFTDRLEEIRAPAHEVAQADQMEVLSHAIAKNVNVALLAETYDPDLLARLTEDRKKFEVIVAAFAQGAPALRVSAVKDEDARQKLTRLEGLFRVFDAYAIAAEKNSPVLAEVKAATLELFRDSEALLDGAEKLDAALQEQENVQLRLYGIAINTLGGLALVFLVLLGYVFINDARHRASLSEQENRRNQDAILRLLNEMGELADGNLTSHALVTADITGAMADSINYTIDELRTLVEGINRASAQVTSASDQAQNVSSELLHAAQEQSREIEQTTAAVLGMAKSISEVSESAAESAKVAEQSLAAAGKGADAVQESIDSMDAIRDQIQETAKRLKRLGESSQEIGEIVALISDITEQTNVLALNAAIQAASAGEAGRGFTVVAEEVQRLAERSGEATKQISALVKTIQGDTHDAVAAMEQSTFGVVEGTKRSDAAGQALLEIELVSKNLAQLISGISDATRAQAETAGGVVKNMEGILQITRQTTEGTKQTASSVGQIAALATELKASVSTFKV